ncbi:MAG: hypothetical protein J0I32_23375 [Sphingobacteriales bacterium]|nr:hypothetical protein [Sphingobacteriales bacterium]OJW01982.1 MAG: hypothetical protein BGO52_00425 [Sphingobacteriales bacterium 44-61]
MWGCCAPRSFFFASKALDCILEDLCQFFVQKILPAEHALRPKPEAIPGGDFLQKPFRASVATGEAQNLQSLGRMQYSVRSNEAGRDHCGGRKEKRLVSWELRKGLKRKARNR